ncbi:MAG TPA: LysM peptidoglycan-binding domain-containing protein, partial [Acidimicrobiales bacterium]|nr:LysM peptidoglycan-binding domain-containing protein [Acidimicrobiales bacterium]
WELVARPHRPALRLVEPAALAPLRVGPALSSRRASRAAQRSRRRRAVALGALALGLTVLAWPGHALGGTTGTGLPSDLATGSALASGSVYVVQSGDTLASIARAMNPVDPRAARVALVRELDSTTVVPGEHVLIP